VVIVAPRRTRRSEEMAQSEKQKYGFHHECADCENANRPQCELGREKSANESCAKRAIAWRNPYQNEPAIVVFARPMSQYQSIAMFLHIVAN
jgi:hypothetical protein